MKRLYTILIIAAASLAALTGCVKEKGMDEGTFIIDSEYLTLNLDQFRQVVTVPVKTNIPESEWKFSSSAEWVQISQSISSDRGLMISVDENGDMNSSRRGQVAVSAGTNQYRIDIVQLGKGPSLVAYPITIGADGGKVTIRVISNVDYHLGQPNIDPDQNKDPDVDWLSLVSESSSYAETQYTFYAENNVFPITRKAPIPVILDVDKSTLDELQKAKIAEIENKYKDGISVEQDPLDTKDMPLLQNDMIDIVAVEGNQIHQGDPSVTYFNLIDHNYTTVYHSPWGIDYEKPTTEFPVEFVFTLKEPSSVESMMVMTAKAWDAESQEVVGDGANGDIGQFEVYYKKAEGDDWTLVGEGNFYQRGGYHQYVFPEVAVDALYIKLSVLSGAGDNGVKGGFVSASQVEFYKSNADDLMNDILDFFTDLSCSELNPDKNITSRDIIRLCDINPVLAVNVASKLYEGKYDPFEYEFRSRYHEAYSDNVAMHKVLFTKTYTAMDNPTGIYVSAGEVVNIAIDKVPAGQKIRAAIYGDNGDEPNYGGGADDEGANQLVGLKAGLNSFKAVASGMLYVLNTSEDLTRYKEKVRVHVFPGAGTVYGFFDSATMDDARYAELLSKCKYKYFTVRGKKFMFTFHTAQLRKDSPNGILSGINAWDKIIGWELELMGLDNNPRFNNHMMAISSEGDGYMDASTRRVRFVTSALEKIISEEALLREEDNSWGPAHEAGHNNQQAINWRSTTESSNNLFSNYVIYKWGKYTSRGAQIADLANSFADPDQPWALFGREGQASYQNEDPDVHMRMNWQLWNYFHRCGYMEDFFPKLFAYLRDPATCLHNEFWAGELNLGDEDLGYSQLQYYKAVSEVTKMDFTEFFNVWGFFKPYDQLYEQYGQAQYTVTQDMIDAAIEEVKSKYGANPAPPIYLIEDRKVKYNQTYSDMGYWETYKNKVKISKTPSGSATDLGKGAGYFISVNNCDQAVGVELRSGTAKDGDLLFFSNRYDFIVPSHVKVKGSTLWAVQYDGARVKILTIS